MSGVTATIVKKVAEIAETVALRRHTVARKQRDVKSVSTICIVKMVMLVKATNAFG
jgi:hypothetical protein